MAIWGFMIQASIGAAGYTLISEVPTSTVRSQTQSLATATNGIFNSVWSFATPYMINPDQANMGGKVAFIFFGCWVVGDVFVYFACPEMKVSISAHFVYALVTWPNVNSHGHVRDGNSRLMSCSIVEFDHGDFAKTKWNEEGQSWRNHSVP